MARGSHHISKPGGCSPRALHRASRQALRWHFAATVLAAACCLGASEAAGQTVVARKHTETLLAPFPEAVWDSAMISPNLRRVAYVRQTAAGQQVVVNGREETPYPKVGLPTFSPDGQRLAYVAMLPDGQRAIVLDGKPGKPCEMVFEGTIVFSPDGRRMAYGARRANGWFLVVGDQELGPYEFLGSSTGFQFGGDGARLAFAALIDKKWCVILDGKPQPPCDNLGPLVFSPDGKRVAYVAMRKEQEKETWHVVADGKPGSPFDAIGEESLVFSPDGKHLAYAARTGGAWCVVLDGTPRGKHDGIGQIAFSPDGRILAYVVKRQSSEAVVTEPLQPPLARSGTGAGGAGKSPPGGSPKPGAPPAGGPGSEGGPEGSGPPRFFDRIGGGTLVFSASGRHLAYVARSGRWSFVVADGNRKPRYDMVGYLTFTPDGRSPVYAAVKGKKTVTVVEDKESSHQYDAIWLPRGEPLRFVGPTRFRYLAVKDGNIYQVDEQID